LDQSFAWDANTEPDLAGYYIYYKNDTSGAPYNGTGAVEGNSPIQIPLTSLNDPSNPVYTLHDLSDTRTVYFVSTTYDIYGNEGGFSNELYVIGDESGLFTSCSGDFTPDGDVDSADLIVFLNAHANGDLTADLNSSGVVDAEDLTIFSSEFGRTDCQVDE
jgi:hypothetical protein